MISQGVSAPETPGKEDGTQTHESIGGYHQDASRRKFSNTAVGRQLELEAANDLAKHQDDWRGYLRQQASSSGQSAASASSADHNVFDALDTQDGFLPAFSADRLMGVDLGLYRCSGRLGHAVISCKVTMDADPVAVTA